MPVRRQRGATPKGKKETLHEKFSEAAARLTELYKESTDAYEQGYHDALLYVHRYVLLSSANPRSHSTPFTTTTDISTTAASTHSPRYGSSSTAQPSIDNAIHSMARVENRPLAMPAVTISPDSAIATERVLTFIQNTVQRRRERVAIARGTAARRRRTQREPELPSQLGESTSPHNSDVEPCSPGLLPIEHTERERNEATIVVSSTTTTSEDRGTQRVECSGESQPPSSQQTNEGERARDLAVWTGAMSIPQSEAPPVPGRGEGLPPPLVRPRYYSPVSREHFSQTPPPATATVFRDVW